MCTQKPHVPTWLQSGPYSKISDFTTCNQNENGGKNTITCSRKNLMSINRYVSVFIHRRSIDLKSVSLTICNLKTMNGYLNLHTH